MNWCFYMNFTRMGGSSSLVRSHSFAFVFVFCCRQIGDSGPRHSVEGHPLERCSYWILVSNLTVLPAGGISYARVHNISLPNTSSSPRPIVLSFFGPFSHIYHFPTGGNPYWEAADLWYDVTVDMEWYDPGWVMIWNSSLVITMDLTSTMQTENYTW